MNDRKDVFCKAYPSNFPNNDDCFFYNQDKNNPCCKKFFEKTAIGEIPVSCFVLNKHNDCQCFISLETYRKYNEWLGMKKKTSFKEFYSESSQMIKDIRECQK